MGATLKKSLREWCEETNHLDLIDQWDLEKNNQMGLNMEDLPPFTGRKAYWKCPIYSDHLYDMRISQRTRQKNGCPYCSGKRVLAGFNDLASKCPISVEEWDYDNNWDKDKKKRIMPTDVSFGSHYDAHFICSKCHEPFHKWVKTYYQGN